MNNAARILLVDDELRFAESLAQLLRLSGFHVTIAHTGNEAVGILEKNVFDLLLLDVELPDMPGYQIMDSLVKRNFGTAAIMLTGNAAVETAIEALKKGAYDYLKKPIDHDLLFSTIDKAIRYSRMEQALKISEERSKTLAESSWEGIVIHSGGQLLDANKQFFDMFGYRPDELLGKAMLDKILSVVSVPEVSFRIQNDTFGCHKSLGLRKDGTEFPIETNCRKIEYQGEMVRVCAIRDISERVRADQEKVELQKQLAVASKMETLGLMAGSVAHDLNNILSGIVTLPELLLMQMGHDHEYSGTIKIIQEAGTEMAAVVSDLITVARGAAAEKAVYNLNTLIKEFIENIKIKKPDSRLNDISIRLACEPGLSNTYCSAVHINKVLMNLIGNAAEEMEAKGTLVVGTKNVSLKLPIDGYEIIEAGDYVVVSITDDGSGIAAEDVEKIFEPFYSKKVMGRSGTGLGLTIVWNTVHDHDGFVDVESGDNGTTFYLYFPVTDNFVKEEELQGAIETFRGGSEVVLVVDDQKQQREIARDLLNSLGYKAETVNSGEEAIAYVKKQPVDLLVLDMILSNGINGRKTYEEILKINPKQRAIIASGFAENGEVKRALFLGASQFIKKPYTMVQMGRAVRKALA